MELHILEHSLKVASIEKEGIQICTHGLIKLAFLASKTRYGSCRTWCENKSVLKVFPAAVSAGLQLFIVPAHPQQLLFGSVQPVFFLRSLFSAGSDIFLSGTRRNWSKQLRTFSASLKSGCLLSTSRRKLCSPCSSFSCCSCWQQAFSCYSCCLRLRPEQIFNNPPESWTTPAQLLKFRQAEQKLKKAKH